MTGLFFVEPDRYFYERGHSLYEWDRSFYERGRFLLAGLSFFRTGQFFLRT